MSSVPLTGSHKEKLFHILRENLVAERPEYAVRDVVLCPLCQRELTFEEVESVEHIIPSNTLRDDPPHMRSVDLSRRAGLTILCRKPRQVASGPSAPQGCNGWKGQMYDRLFKGRMAGQPIAASQLKLRHCVAVLTMAYLAAFQRFGYGCITSSAFDSIRLQADFPDQPITPWLDHVRIRLPKHDPNLGVWATTSGLPFVFGWSAVEDASLEVIFRRFIAVLPGGHWAVRHDQGLLLPIILETET